MGKKWTFDIFLKNAKNKHGGKYDYSLAKFDFIDRSSTIRIVCPIHGEVIQTVDGHLKGHGCTQCGYSHNSKNKRKTKDQFIIDANNIHGNKYDYSLVEYITSKHKVKILCHIHGEFEKSPNHHLKGQGCPKCSIKSLDVINNKRHNDIKRDFVKKAKNVHRDDFEYLSEYVDAKTKILIKCNKCGLEFKQKPHSHLL